MIRHRLALTALILLASALRLYELDAQSFWYDEGVTAQVAQLGVGELTRWTADDIQPPLYYLLVSGWLRLNPFGELILRLPSALFGTLLIPLLWALGRRLWDERAGLLAALAAATSPLLVYYGQEARMYTLLLALVALAALAVLKWVGRCQVSGGRCQVSGSRCQVSGGRWQVASGRGQGAGDRGQGTGGGGEVSGVRWQGAGGRGQGAGGTQIAYILAALAALYTHYFAAFALLALALYWGHVWWREERDRRELAGFLGANLLVGLGYLPWIPAMLNRFQVDSSYWTGRLKLGEALLDVAINFTVGATEVMLEQDARAWLVGFSVAALVWALMAFQHPRRGRQRPIMLLALWGLLPVALILALAYRTPKFNARYLMVSWPAWALLIGGGLSALWKGEAADMISWLSLSLRRLLFASTLVLLLAGQGLGLLNWFGNDNFAKSAWREAIGQMYGERQEDEAALLVSGHAYPVFDTYLPPRFGVRRQRLPELDILDVNQVIGWAQAARTLNQMAGEYGGVWLFLWQDQVIDPSAVTVTLLDRYADPLPVPEFAYLGLRHYRFRPAMRFPEQPPALGRPADFGGLLRLAGVEAREDGLWLYWQALQPDLPDLQAAISVRSNSGAVLFQEDARPAGYEFPTSRWQAGEIYPARMAPQVGNLTLAVTVYETESGKMVGAQEIFVEATPAACPTCGVD